MAFLTVMTLNALSFSALLFLLSAGFSLVFGLMRVPNMAHGAFFLIGGYFGAQVLAIGLPFGAAVVLSALGMAIIGALTERLLLRQLAHKELAQVLATLGLAFVLSSGAILIWGGMPIQVSPPDLVAGPVRVAGVMFPAYRLLLIVIALIVGALLWYFIDRTRIGAMIRAGVDDAPMAQAVGIRVSSLFTTVFALGAALAGLGGTLAAPLLTIYPGLDFEMLSFAFIVVIVGGVGSLFGAVVGSLAIGFIYTFGQAYFTEFAFALLFAVMIAVLAVRPQGLFGRAAA